MWKFIPRQLERRSVCYLELLQVAPTPLRGGVFRLLCFRLLHEIDARVSFGSRRPIQPVAALAPTIRGRVGLLALVMVTLGGCGGTRANEAAKVASHPNPETVCPEFSTGRILGFVKENDLEEVSGMVVSRKNPGVIWVHNDSGARPRLHAVAFSGEYRGAFPLRGAELVDWEDIAIGPGPRPGQWFIYVSDLGANKMERDHGVIYRVMEPEILPEQDDKKRRLNNVEAYRVRYPDFRRIPDSEALLVDPRDSRVYVVTKSRENEPRVYRAPHPLKPARDNVLELVGTLRLGDDGMSEVTAGDISLNGSKILLRTYWGGYLWHRKESQSVADALRGEPCRIRLKDAIQGEAIAWAPWGLGFMTLSEGKDEPIYYYSIEE